MFIHGTCREPTTKTLASAATHSWNTTRGTNVAKVQTNPLDTFVQLQTQCSQYAILPHGRPFIQQAFGAQFRMGSMFPASMAGIIIVSAEFSFKDFKPCLQ